MGGGVVVHLCRNAASAAAKWAAEAVTQHNFLYTTARPAGLQATARREVPLFVTSVTCVCVCEESYCKCKVNLSLRHEECM
jgi:hypothetical protein